MTEKQFWETSECWFQRTHRLRRLSESETETPERKRKATKLFFIMFFRMQDRIQTAIKLSYHI